MNTPFLWNGYVSGLAVVYILLEQMNFIDNYKYLSVLTMSMVTMAVVNQPNRIRAQQQQQQREELQFHKSEAN